jgi:hypothetical protein
MKLFSVRIMPKLMMQIQNGPTHSGNLFLLGDFLFLNKIFTKSTAEWGTP